MISDREIWRAAELLIRAHGVDAVTEATRLVHLMLRRRDSEGVFLWASITRAIEALQQPPSGRLN